LLESGRCNAPHSHLILNPVPTLQEFYGVK
jgi:hypothetical protein